MRSLNRLSYIFVFSILCVFIGFHRLTLPKECFFCRNQQSHKHQSVNVEQKTFPEQILVVYNRIPKTGSTSFMNVTYRLTLINRFSAALIKLSTKKYLWYFKDQYFFAKNITLWHTRKPAIYHGHFPFLNFIKLGFSQPLYINIIREPLERFVSHYYFLRYGDTFSPCKIRKRHGDMTTFDECVEQKKYDCSISRLWLQIPYFCGSDPGCWKPGNEFALHRAKRNVLNYYFLVGTTEKIGNFVEILDKILPRIFKGADRMFNSGEGVHIRKTKKKFPLREDTIAFIKATSIWKMEQDFYLFVKKRFDAFCRNFHVGRSIEYVWN